MSEIQNSSNQNIAEAQVGASAPEALKQQDRDNAKKAIAARLFRNGIQQEEPVDLSYRLAEGERVEPVTPESPEALEVYRHSTAHLLAAAVLDLYPGTKLGIGPALLDDSKGGFFYDFAREDGGRFTPEDLPKIEKRMKDLIKRNLEYRRVEMTKAEAEKKFAELGEPLKCELIEEKAGDIVSCYTIEGTPFIDFCLGPHIPSTSKIKAIKLLSIAGAHWKGDEKREQMQRIYGTSFFSQEELDEWVKQKEEAEKRGWQLVYTDAAGSAAKQVADVRSMIAQKVDVILLAPREEKPLIPAVMEAKKAGMSMQAVIEMCCLRGWASFKADWVSKDNAAGMSAGGASANQTFKDCT